ncbi:MAG TPA: hypothetical protein VF590_13460 [Isosphaeraceae bacterium]|jgi:hypothetical protein
MSRETWNAIVWGSLAAFAGGAWLGFSLGFAPGWANGWPLGLTIHSVWSTGMAVLLFWLSLTSSASLGAAIGSLCAPTVVGRRWGRPAYVAWLVVAAGASLVLSCRAFQGIYASTFEMWPQGYHPGGLNP